MSSVPLPSGSAPFSIMDPDSGSMTAYAPL
jgi:hypothetical protein